MEFITLDLNYQEFQKGDFIIVLQNFRDKIRNTIEKSLKEKKEYGLLFCNLNGWRVSDAYIGEERSIELGSCPPGSKEKGSFHTHPFDEDLIPRHSVSDIIVSLANKEDFSCVGVKGNRLECIQFLKKDLIRKYPLLELERRESLLRYDKNPELLKKFHIEKDELLNRMERNGDIKVERFSL
jgi:predicted ATPase